MENELIVDKEKEAEMVKEALTLPYAECINVVKVFGWLSTGGQVVQYFKEVKARYPDLAKKLEEGNQ